MSILSKNKVSKSPLKHKGGKGHPTGPITDAAHNKWHEENDPKQTGEPPVYTGLHGEFSPDYKPGVLTPSMSDWERDPASPGGWKKKDITVEEAKEIQKKQKKEDKKREHYKGEKIDDASKLLNKIRKDFDTDAHKKEINDKIKFNLAIKNQNEKRIKYDKTNAVNVIYGGEDVPYEGYKTETATPNEEVKKSLFPLYKQAGINANSDNAQMLRKTLRNQGNLYKDKIILDGSGNPVGLESEIQEPNAQTEKELRTILSPEKDIDPSDLGVDLGILDIASKEKAITEYYKNGGTEENLLIEEIKDDNGNVIGEKYYVNPPENNEEDWVFDPELDEDGEPVIERRGIPYKPQQAGTWEHKNGYTVDAGSNETPWLMEIKDTDLDPDYVEFRQIGYEDLMIPTEIPTELITYTDKDGNEIVVDPQNQYDYLFQDIDKETLGDNLLKNETLDRYATLKTREDQKNFIEKELNDYWNKRVGFLGDPRNMFTGGYQRITREQEHVLEQAKQKGWALNNQLQERQFFLDEMISVIEPLKSQITADIEFLGKTDPEKKFKELKAKAENAKTEEEFNAALQEWEDFQEDYNEALTRFKKDQNTMLAWNDLIQDTYADTEELMQDTEEWMIFQHMAGLNYGNFYNGYSAFVTSFIDFAGGLVKYNEMFTQDLAIKALLDQGIMDEDFGEYLMQTQPSDMLFSWSEYYKGKRQKYGDTWAEDPWEYTTMLIIEQSPQLAIGIASGGLGAAPAMLTTSTAFSLSATGQSFQRFEKEGLEGFDLYSTAMVHGYLEGASEAILAKQAGTSWLKLWKPAIKTGGKWTIGNTLRKSIGLAAWTGERGTIEGTTEAINQFGQNLWDKNYLKKDIHVLDNVDKAFYDGFLTSGGISSPVIVKQAIAGFMTPSLSDILGKNSDRILELQQFLSDPDLSPELLTKYEQEFAQLITDNNLEFDKAFKSIASISETDRQEIMDIEVEKYNLKKQARDTKDDKAIPEEEKNSEIEKITKKYNEIESKRLDILARNQFTPEQIEENYNNFIEETNRQAEEYEKRTGKKVSITEMTSLEIAETQLRMIAELEAEIKANKDVLKREGAESAQGKIAAGNLRIFEAQLRDVQGAHEQFGMFGRDAEGNMTIIINKESSLAKDGRIATAAHEFLHAVVFNTIGQNPEIQAQMGEALVEFIAKKKGGFSPEFLRRMQAYGTWVKNEKGENVFIQDSNFGEELMMVMSESLLDGSLKYDEGFFIKLGDILRRFLQNQGWKKIRFDTGRQVYNFIKDYNHSIKNKYTSKAITEMMDKGAKGKLTEVKTEAKIESERKSQFSKNVQQELTRDPDLKFEFDQFTQNPDGTKKYNSKEDFQKSVDFWPAYEMITNTKKLDGLIMANVADIIKPDEMGDFVEKVKERLGERFLKNFNANKANGSLFGWMTGGGGVFAESMLYRSKGDVMNEYKKQLPTVPMEKVTPKTEPLVEPMFDELTEKQNEELQSPRSKTNVLKFEKVAEKTDNIRKVVKVKEGDTFKEITDKYTGPVGKEIFNVPAEKITDPKKNLTHAKKIIDGIPEASEAGNIQNFYATSDNMGKTIRILPKENVTSEDADVNELGENIQVSPDVSGRSLGLTGRVLKYFYNPVMKPDGKQKRSKGKTSQVGLWKLKPEFVNPTSEVIEKTKKDLGITPRGELNNYNRDIGQFLKGLAKFQAQQTALSAAQRNLADVKAPKQQIADVTAAQSPLAFSKKIKEYRDASKLVPVDKLAPRDEVFLETTDKTGFIKGEIITRKDLEKDYDEVNKITWEEFYMNELLDFFETYPQYYNVMESALTGGVKNAAFFNKAYFERTIKKFAKKNNRLNVIEAVKKADQVGPKRLYYHGDGKWKGLKNIDLSIDNGKTEFLINFYNNISKYTKKQGKEIFQEVLTHFGIDQNNFMRKSAKLIAFPVDEKGREIIDQKGVEEHAVQMEMARIMMGAAFDGNMKEATKLLKAVYSQISLLKQEDPGGEHKQSMGNDFYNDVVPRILDGSLDFLPDGYASIYRLMKAGVNPFGYKLINEKQTIAEYFGVNNLSIEKAQQAIIDVFEGKQDINVLRAQSIIPINKGVEKNLSFSRATNNARLINKDTKLQGMSVWDFDDTLAKTKSKVLFTRPDGTKGKLNAQEYASQYVDLLEQGYKFDFSEFNLVVDPTIGPFFEKFQDRIKKFGVKNNFILTARPAESAPAIKEFLKSQGLNIPLKNITGLANSTSEAKALWMADKVGEGYNDIYFADDALQNVEAVKNILNQFDVKSVVQQAKIQFSKDISKEFNSILEEKTGVEAQKIFSTAKAQKRGQRKGRFKFFIPPSAEDFKGLIYAFLPKGKKGDAAMKFFKKALLDPFARGYRELNSAKQNAATDYKALRKAMPDVRKLIGKKIPAVADYTYGDAIRVYLWDKAGFDVPGLSKADLTNLTGAVNNNPELKAYADALGLISKRPEGYVPPSEHWLTGNILSDLSDANHKIGRSEFLAEWIQNKDIIFSEENLNKIEAIYGSNFREALEDILYRMENGTNRTFGSNRLVNQFTNWINNSVGAIMFFNARSAVLQTLSTVNFINWGDNNIVNAAAAFANQKQFWKDFAFLFNSDMLKQRRKGLKTDVNASEIAQAVSLSRNKVSAALNWLLQKGFLPTQMADSFAIASGGATFYRNRVNTYLKQGLSQKQAETKAFEDFQEVAEETQQSSRPDLISQQQASVLGRLILAFQNTPMQYMRLTKKAMSDLINGRGDPKANISKIIYYMGVQNVIFYSLQSALFALAFDDDDEEPTIDAEKKKMRVLNGMLDSILRGIGVGGAIVSTVKNTIIKIGEQEQKSWNKDLSAPLVELLNLSPPIGSKARKFISAYKTWDYNEEVVKEMDIHDVDNPVWEAVGNVISAATNVPLDRLINKTKNIREALNEDNETWQRIALMLGWNRWDLGVKSEKIETVKTNVKQKKKEDKKKKKEEKEKAIQEEKQLEVNTEVKEEKKKEAEGKMKEFKCANVNAKGARCNNIVAKAGMRCTVHEVVEQREDGKKTKCKGVRTNGESCNMMTTAKSGYCVYHDN